MGSTSSSGSAMHSGFGLKVNEIVWFGEVSCTHTHEGVRGEARRGEARRGEERRGLEGRGYERRVEESRGERTLTKAWARAHKTPNEA